MPGHTFYRLEQNSVRCLKCGYQVDLDLAKKVGVSLEDLFALRCLVVLAPLPPVDTVEGENVD